MRRIKLNELEELHKQILQQEQRTAEADIEIQAARGEAHAAPQAAQESHIQLEATESQAESWHQAAASARMSSQEQELLIFL